MPIVYIHGVAVRNKDFIQQPGSIAAPVCDRRTQPATTTANRGAHHSGVLG